MKTAMICGNAYKTNELTSFSCEFIAFSEGHGL